MINKELAKLDPSSVFKSPRDILTEPSLTQAEKIDILERWAYDEREIEVAEEENMAPQAPHHDVLDEIMKCLLELNVGGDHAPHAPTKQG